MKRALNKYTDQTGIGAEAKKERNNLVSRINPAKLEQLKNDLMYERDKKTIKSDGLLGVISKDIIINRNANSFNKSAMNIADNIYYGILELDPNVPQCSVLPPMALFAGLSEGDRSRLGDFLAARTMETYLMVLDFIFDGQKKLA